MNLYEAKKILNRNGCKLIKEATTYYTLQVPEVEVPMGNRTFIAGKIVAFGQVTAGFGGRGEDEDYLEIDPDTVDCDADYWTDETGEHEYSPTPEMRDKLCEILASMSGWEPVNN